MHASIYYLDTITQLFSESEIELKRNWHTHLVTEVQQAAQLWFRKLKKKSFLQTREKKLRLSCIWKKCGHFSTGPQEPTNSAISPKGQQSLHKCPFRNWKLDKQIYWKSDRKQRCHAVHGLLQFTMFGFSDNTALFQFVCSSQKRRVMSLRNDGEFPPTNKTKFNYTGMKTVSFYS